jgi:cytidine deaminase
VFARAHLFFNGENMTDTELIALAATLIAPKQTKQGVVADVGSVLISAQGLVFTGVCVGTNSGTICAERTAIAKMISDSQEYGIKRIVAVWKDADGAVFVIPPCGYCRQFMADTDSRNIHETVVVLSHDVAVPLRDLLPFHDWWQRQP